MSPFWLLEPYLGDEKRQLFFMSPFWLPEPYLNYILIQGRFISEGYIYNSGQCSYKFPLINPYMMHEELAWELWLKPKVPNQRFEEFEEC